jgi:hypothetical protein
MDLATPKVVEGLRTEIMDGETVLYQDVLKKMIYLNESATVVFQLCDGVRTVREIIDVLRSAYLEASGSIAQDVLTVIDYLVEEGAVRLELAMK